MLFCYFSFLLKKVPSPKLFCFVLFNGADPGHSELLSIFR